MPRLGKAPRTFVGRGVLLVGVLATALAITTPRASGNTFPGRTRVGSTLTALQRHEPHRHHHHGRTLHYFISGDVTKALYPGTSSAIDLSFSNPNRDRITVPAGAITITISSPRKGCPVKGNFEVVHTLTASISIPGHTTTTLKAMGVDHDEWPVVKMLTTPRTQDVCGGMTFFLNYSAGDSR